MTLKDMARGWGGSTCDRSVKIVREEVKERERKAKGLSGKREYVCNSQMKFRPNVNIESDPVATNNTHRRLDVGTDAAALEAHELESMKSLASENMVGERKNLIRAAPISGHQPPDSLRDPFTLKPLEDSLQLHNDDLPSVEVRVTKDEPRKDGDSQGQDSSRVLSFDYCTKAWNTESNPTTMSSPTTAPMPSPSRGVLAELLGRQAGKSHGKGRSMHIFTPSSFGGNGIVGAQVPVGAGAAFAQMYRARRPLRLQCMEMEGATRDRSLRRMTCPSCGICPTSLCARINKYRMSTRSERSSSNTSYCMRGDMIPGLQANGTDIIVANQAVQYTRNWAVYQANGPLILEFVTYRYVQRMRSTRDPIRGLQKYLEEWGVLLGKSWSLTIDGWRSGIDLDKEANTVVVETAKSLPEPVVKDLCGDISCNGTEPEMMTGREREEFHCY
ncbi:thiamine diphosphate-binding protein [Coprinopsis sp. MPI-PUGE-AT-0042]|nr:thiamine diphosphate-binding protein [Coprinopsis sp. MPI-PUGE-AT-0042]